jgi:predicted metal-dependent hydrolase
MILSYEFASETIQFSVIFRNRRTLSIRVESKDVITVFAPAGLKEEQILAMVKTKSKWILGKLHQFQETASSKSEKQFVDGELFLYEGCEYGLHVLVDESRKRPKVRLEQGQILVYSKTASREVIKQALVDWYWAKAKERIQERVQYHLTYFPIVPELVVVKNQQKRWGSCNSKQHLFFNWKIIMAPEPVLDYVVVHEMCHMVHLNHSKEYWQLVKTILPDYQQRKVFLRNNGVKYDL